MIPVVTPQEMARIDAAAPEPVDVLIERAGAAVARAARQLLGGTYGRRVLVVAGKGNNGNDGRVAARLLAAAGVRVELAVPADRFDRGRLARVDLVIDAAFGTGFVDRGTWTPPDLGGRPVLAVDIPSGVDGLTGTALDGVVPASRTVTFAAAKPGLLLQPGRSLAGSITVADIGLDCSSAIAGWVTAADVGSWLPRRPVDAHKWQAAVWLLAGSPGMTGAAHLACRAAQRAGAGYVRISSPGVADDPRRPTEAVGVPLPESGWASEVAAGAGRFRALVVGPGLGRAAGTDGEVRRMLTEVAVPLVVDGDGLAALAALGGIRPPGWPAPRILTPHDGEFRLLTGRLPGPDRFAEARGLARDLGAIVVLKGPTTIVADPAGSALVVTEGDARLATAGTGDVLAGLIGALLARGVEPLAAAAAGAFIHGRAGRLGPASGLVAGDLPDRLPEVLAELALAADADGPVSAGSAAGPGLAGSAGGGQG